jgi:hypothetical protein
MVRKQEWQEREERKEWQENEERKKWSVEQLQFLKKVRV